jgi:hypothetical protein
MSLSTHNTSAYTWFAIDYNLCLANLKQIKLHQCPVKDFVLSSHIYFYKNSGLILFGIISLSIKTKSPGFQNRNSIPI